METGTVPAVLAGFALFLSLIYALRAKLENNGKAAGKRAKAFAWFFNAVIWAAFGFRVGGLQAAAYMPWLTSGWLMIMVLDVVYHIEEIADVLANFRKFCGRPFGAVNGARNAANE